MADCEMTDVSENRLDPMRSIHEDLHDLILQHISGISCSEVSKIWSIAVTNSAKAVKNIQLDLSPKNNTEHPSADELEIILNSNRNYSSIIYENSYAQTFLKKCEVLEIFKNFLVELQIGDLLINSDNIWSSLALPKLESLTVAHENSHHLVLHLLRTSKKLKKLAFLPEVPLSHRTCNAIIDIFKEDNELKQLELGSYMSMYLFVHDVSHELKLKLESFVIKQFHQFFLPNVEHFLPTQAQTLKKLDMDFITDRILKLIIEKMIVLEFLKLGSLETLSLDSFTGYEQQNPRIQELNLPSFSTQTIKLLLKIMPNVKTLHLLWVTNKELEVIVKSGRNLEKIYFKENREESLNFYNELKKRGEEEINSNIQFIQA